MEDFEDSEFVASEHDRLVSAVSKLDKTQHIAEPTRSEPSVTNSEFNLNKRSKLDLSDVVKVLEESSTNTKISKKLKRSHDESRILRKPLERPQAERIKRATGYDETKKKVGRWDAVVARSRTADYVVFPTKPIETKLQPTGEFLERFELKSELEKELEEIDPPAISEEPEEEVKTFPMSYEEMVEQRKHLAKLRAQQSYRAAKAKRQSKIKSKKYHRVLKKERLKQQLKEFEELQKTDPEEALKRLETIEKARALERHTLRHKSTGKWAKNKLIRAKYDKDVRQQLADQLAVSRGLTQKTKDIVSSDDEADNNEGIPDITLSQDPMNPWMLKQSNKSNVSDEFNFGYKKYLQNRKVVSESDTDDEAKEDNTDTTSKLSILKENLNKITQHADEADSLDESETNDSNPANENKTDDQNEDEDNQGLEINHIIQKQKKGVVTPTSNKTLKKSSKLNKVKSVKTVATSSWVVEQIVSEKEEKNEIDISSAFDSFTNTVTKKVEKKLNALRQKLEKSSTNTKTRNKKRKNEDEEFDNLEYLKFKNPKQRAIIDEALIETTSKEAVDTETNVSAQARILNAVPENKEPAASNIDPNRFIQVKPKYLNSALPEGDNEMDLLDDDQIVPKVNIEEVFEEDDVVASFKQEKDDEANKDKSEDIDLSLPGWGSWGGKGIKTPKKKKNRFITKAAPEVPRRDENKGNIIIKEYTDPKLIAHRVKEIPFPFNSVKDFEASIRAPLGNTFVPEKAHQKLIRPNVITKAGAIIEPINEDELLQARNFNYKNAKVLKMTGNK